MERQDGDRRRTQKERSTETRNRLLEAATDCLVELGWNATTTPEVAKRAQLSRGAQQHHFPTKADLLASLTVHITKKFHADLRERAGSLPSGSERTRAAIDLVWQAYSGRLATAHSELWQAARTDTVLHTALYQAERSHMHETRPLLRTLFSEHPRHAEQLDRVVDLTLLFVRGLVMRQQLSGVTLHIERPLEDWKRVAERLITEIEAGRTSFEEVDPLSFI